jgi:hypothetical protein
MTMPLPLNAQPIVDARLRGFKPDELILVSLVGHVAAANHVVRAVPSVAYDWRWVHGLEVCVYVGERMDWVDTVKAIALQRPAYLGLWDCSKHWGAEVYLVPTGDDVAKPVREWTYQLDFLSWMDFQSADFIEGRTYNRTSEGMPHAVNP